MCRGCVGGCIGGCVGALRGRVGFVYGVVYGLLRGSSNQEMSSYANIEFTCEQFYMIDIIN